MSAATSFTTAVPIFQGQRGMYYIYDGIKYDIRFPLGWAMDHKTIYDHNFNQYFASGPRQCDNCFCHGSINGVFVGYCTNCLKDFYPDNSRGYWHINPGSCVKLSTDQQFWAKYPYMTGVRLSDIGDIDIDQDQDLDLYEPQYIHQDLHQQDPELYEQQDEQDLQDQDLYEQQDEQDLQDPELYEQQVEQDLSYSTHSSMPYLMDVDSVSIQSDMSVDD
jgi:hypothetical protein